jgi:hypothetical protein
MKAKQLLLIVIFVGAIGAFIVNVEKDKNVMQQRTPATVQLPIEGELPSKVAQAFGEHEGVLQGEGGSLPDVWPNGVRGVANEADRAMVPSRQRHGQGVTVFHSALRRKNATMTY